MNAVLFDTLKYAHGLKEAGFNEKQAEGAAEALGHALTGTVATKADIDALAATTKADITTLGARLEAKIAEVSSKVDIRFSENVRWMFATVVVNVGAIVGLLKLLK